LEDELGDLGDMMGDDYDHGYDDSNGDPNVKPKRAPPPKMVVQDVTQTSMRLVFPAQQQFLQKLTVQLIDAHAISDAANPFSSFSTSNKEQCFAVDPPDDPKTATSCVIEGLKPGNPYFSRLLLRNPAGATPGTTSKLLVTKPAAPAAPEHLHAKSNVIYIKFPPQNLGGQQHVTKLTIGVARAGPSNPFAAKHKPGEMSDSGPTCALLKQARVQKLTPGSLYVFRLTAHNAAGSTVGEISTPMLTAPATPSRLHEDSRQRTSSEIAVKFEPHKQHLKKLTIQYAVLQGRAKFDDLMKKKWQEYRHTRSPERRVLQAHEAPGPKKIRDALGCRKCLG